MRPLNEFSDAEMHALLGLIVNTADCPVCAPSFTDDACPVCKGEGFVWRAVGTLDDQEGTR